MKVKAKYVELIARYCGFDTRETCAGYFPQAELKLLGGVEVALWDIYGTLFATRAGDLESSLSAADSMLRAFEIVIESYGLEGSIKRFSKCPPLWLRDHYLGGIAKEHARLKTAGFPVPEVRIEEIWQSILTDLCESGFNIPGKNLQEFAFEIAFCFEVAFQRPCFYTGALDILLELKKLGITQGIVSNAQFYTPILLDIFFDHQTDGQISDYRQLFHSNLCSFSFQHRRSKPDPRIFAPVIGSLRAKGITQEKAIYIGNDLLNDIYAAGKLGFKTAFFAADEPMVKFHETDPRVKEFVPDITVKDFAQLPGLFGREPREVLNVGMAHYHFRAGGVTSVVRDTIDALEKCSTFRQVNIQLFADFSDSALDQAWIENRKRPGKLDIEIMDIPALGYNGSPPEDPDEFEKLARQLADEILEKVDLTGLSKFTPYILHVHNLSLGKNPLYSRAFVILAERAQEKALPLVLVSQIHDFAELNRPDVDALWRRFFPGSDQTARAETEFPRHDNIIHAGLTSADCRRLLATGLPGNAVFLLPNSVKEGAVTNRRPCSVIESHLDGRPYLFMPQKVMRRKNTLEALMVQLALAAVGYDYGIVVTLPAAGEQDRKFENLVRETAKQASIPSVIVSQAVFGSDSPPFEDVFAGCSATLTVSVMEGFGMTFLEGWVRGRAVLGRRIAEPCADFESAGINLDHLYDRLLIDSAWLDEGLEPLINRYRETFNQFRDGYGMKPLSFNDFEKEFRRAKIYKMGSKTCLDFADLDPENQAGIVLKASGDKPFARELLALNPELESWPGIISGSEALIEANRIDVLDTYGSAAKAKRLETVYRAVVSGRISKGRASRQIKSLSEENMKLDNIRLLYFDLK